MSDDDRDNDLESDADKRAHHNALERKRRDHIKDSFSSLRDSLPCMAGEKVSVSSHIKINNLKHTLNAKKQSPSTSQKASRAQVLKKAADYIQQMRRKNTAHQQDIEDLKRQNKILEDQIRNLEKAKATGNFTAANTVIDTSHYNSKNDTISAFDGGSSSESSDTDGSKDGRRKKLKTTLIDTPLRA